MEYRREYHRDVFIDLVCFRRLGHNEADEPMVTQPLMYKKINQHPGTRKLYADALVREGVIAAEEADAMVATYRAAMDKGLHTNKTVLSNYKAPMSVDWTPYNKREWTDAYDSTVPLPHLTALAQKGLHGKPHPIFKTFMAQPRNGPLDLEDDSGKISRQPNELALWTVQMHPRYEIGTVYTVIAGLLNILVICDAYGGPLVIAPREKKKGVPNNGTSGPATPTPS
jgi:hypothetical protein